MNFLAIILARGGSKSIPHKNIKLLGGKPLIAHTVQLAKKIKEFQDVIVSSDDLVILDIAKNNGADIILRPASLATDDSSSESAIIHALEKLANEDKKYDAVVLLEPTSPLRKQGTIEDAIATFNSNNYTSLVSVVEDFSTFWNSGKIPERLFPNQSRRRQERQPLLKEVGVIYISKVDSLLRNKTFISDNLFLFKVDLIESIDINNEIDFTIADILVNEI